MNADPGFHRPLSATLATFTPAQALRWHGKIGKLSGRGQFGPTYGV